MSQDIRSYVVSEFESGIEGFVKDLGALTHEDLNRSFGSGSRCAYDFIYEVGVINRRVAFRLRSEDPGPMPWKFGEEWLQAPDDFKTKETALEHMTSTAAELVAAVGDDVTRGVTVGEKVTPAYQLVNFATFHTGYHDAQLNFIQSLAGDMAVHW